MKALLKELRPLSLPFWLTLALAAVLPLVRMLNNPVLLGDATTLWGLLMVLTQLLFFCGILVLAALPFGMEFQYQTFPLLLSQPRSRWSIWKERTLLAGILIGICGLVHWVSHMVVMIPALTDAIQRLAVHTLGPSPLRSFNPGIRLSDVSGMDLLAIFAFMLATACTASFWTLGGRSIIAGVVFTVAGEFLGMGAVYAAVSRFTEDERVFVLAVVFAGPIWCALFLWLGWRGFATIELKAAAPGQSGEMPFLSRLSWRPRFLQSGASSRLANLIRKELRLQKPIFLITILFVVSWTVAALLSRAKHVQHTIYEPFLFVMTIGYLPIFAMLSGSLAVVDEKTLGIAAWHLTFPVRAFSQWFLKMLVAVAVTTVGVCVPFLMFWLLPPSVVAVPDLNYAPHFWAVLGVGAIVSIVSFWAATVTDAVVLAAILAIASLAMLGAAAALGIWSGDQFNGLQTGILKHLMTWLTANDLDHLNFRAVASIVVIVVLAVLILRRSFVHFRCLNVPKRKTAFWALRMLFLSCAGGFWLADLMQSVARVVAGY
jgi:uncharacterized membrane protein